MLEADDRLIISPCAGLERAPFAALPSGSKMLCERATLSTVHGIGMFDACAQRPMLTWRTAACLGAPSRQDLPRLGNASVEVAKVAELLSHAGVAVAEPQTGPSATVAALRQLVSNSDLVHIACHAEPPSSQYPGGLLMLAPDLLTGDSGVLSDDRILGELAVKPGALVTLAACSSGLFGSRQRVLDHGLAPALLVAGAGQVLGSLVPIEDATALDFHIAFYRHLISGKRPAAALACAQREAAAGELGLALQPPSQWATYVLYVVG
jgi:CHAT domain-containing protein